MNSAIGARDERRRRICACECIVSLVSASISDRRIAGQANVVALKLRGQGPRAGATRRDGCMFAPPTAAREDVGRRAAGHTYACARGFSPGPKPGRGSFKR